jgi:hypothetical protein
MNHAAMSWTIRDIGALIASLSNEPMEKRHNAQKAG